MKRYLALFLAILTVSLVLIGCGEDGVPSFEKASRKSDAWLTRNLKGYSQSEMIEAWGIYDLCSGGPMWEIEDSKKEHEYISLEFDENDICIAAERITLNEIQFFKQQSQLMGKPVIYLYPEEQTAVTVQVDIGKEFTSVYPAYHDGWKMIASPDGTLTDPNTGREYYCLFWEGISDTGFDFSTGFCVKGSDTAAFLEDALGKLGLTEREANEFIIYWLPQMESNPYNRISFQKEAYTEQAKLTVTPTPDTVIRVFMAWEGLDEAVEIAPQELSAPEREGFTVVEWGAGEIGK